MATTTAYKIKKVVSVVALSNEVETLFFDGALTGAATGAIG
jgi:hypothetical protein